jgi:hypothetical protein
LSYRQMALSYEVFTRKRLCKQVNLIGQGANVIFDIELTAGKPQSVLCSQFVPVYPGANYDVCPAAWVPTATAF